MGILLHIGLPKTATTTLQNALFKNHSQIFYLGKYLGTGASKCRKGEEWPRLLKSVIWEMRKPCDLDRLRVHYAEMLLREQVGSKRIIGSWETLSRRSAQLNLEMVRRISSVSGACRLMIALRNPLTHLPSLYLQHIRGNFLRQNRAFMGKAPFMEMDEWHSKMISGNSGMAEVNAHLETIRLASAVLGKENVGVFLFEDLMNDPDRYYQSICEFIGVDVDEGASLSRQKHMNRRISQGQLDWLKMVNASRWRKLWLLGFGRRRGKQAFSRLENAGPPAKVKLSGAMIEAISVATRDGHRWLMNHYGLALDDYGCPL